MGSSVQEVRQLLGQCFFIGFNGVELTPSAEKFIRENKIGGVTLFANNYESPGQVAELVNHLQSLSPDLPMVIAVDHEGGRVQRFKKPFTKIPAAQVIAEKSSPKMAFEIGELMARELKAVGVNTVFAPVADINTNAKNPVIGDRAFGNAEEVVSRMVSGFVRGFLTGGVQCVVKHFPGHGDTTKDSHFHLPKVDTPFEVLRDRELKPFLKAFKSRCDAVMTAHIIVKSIDPDVPATLCSKVIQGMLRQDLRFRGLVFSDDMEMKAMTDHFGVAEAPLRALEAGVNALLYHTEEFEIPAFEKILEKLTSSGASKHIANLKDSAKRIEEFKRKHFGTFNPIVLPEINAAFQKPEHLALAKKLNKMA